MRQLLLPWASRAARLLLTLGVIMFAGLARAEPMGAADARHFLDRVGFGATPAEIAAYARMSRSQAVKAVLAPVSARPRRPPPADVAAFIPRSKVRAMREDDKKAFHQEQVRRNILLRGWWLQEMLAAGTPAEQLRERMTLFWHNHFVSSVAKVKSSALMLQQNQLFREQALGDFGQLLHAAAKDPAMLVYLDSAQNRKGSPNENFAREVMELFTLGEGSYSEQDIKEAARAYTGWSLDPDSGAFKWRPFFHDSDDKTVLGRRGNFDGDAVLDILLAQPQAAEFITAKLWREFISPQPDPTEVGRIARQWHPAAGKPYDLRVLMGLLLESEAFWAQENRGALLKSPVDLVVGTLRNFDMRDVDALPFVFAVGQLGQDLFAPPNVKGWPGGEAWINSNTLLGRKQFLDRLLRSDRAGGNMAKGSGAQMVATKAGSATGMDGPQLRKRLLRALEEVHIDLAAWQADLDAQKLAPEQALLAVPAEPASAVAVTTPGDRVRALVLDSAYQLK